MSTLKITFYNFSAVQWDRAYFANHGVEWADKVVHEPSKSLDAIGGSTTSEVDCESGGTLEADMETVVEYKYYNNGVEEKFGVACKVHPQVLGIGKGCTWSVNKDGKWHQRDESGADYTWHFSGKKVVATPDVHHSHMSIEVNITDT